MIIDPLNPIHDLPVAYGGCGCDCHRMGGVSHVMPCCGPEKPTEHSVGTGKRDPYDDFGCESEEEYQQKIIEQLNIMASEMSSGEIYDDSADYDDPNP
jgi:hypothetical protein